MFGASIAGNLGLNSNFKATPEEPMTILAKDLNNNGKPDAMIFNYMKAEDKTRKPFPMHTKDDLSSQLVSIRKKYPTYKSYGLASVNELWSRQDRENAVTKTANDLASSYIENKGNGVFTIKQLPVAAQTAPLFGIVSEDIDNDENLDLVLVGNDYGMEPGGGRHDAFNGLVLKGDGAGNFASLTIAESGFFVKGDGKGLALIHTPGQDLLLATQNQDSLLVFSRNANLVEPDTKWINLEPGDFCAEIYFNDKRKQRSEFYYGSTFLSQSSRKMRVDKNVIKIIISDFRGNKREVTPE